MGRQSPESSYLSGHNATFIAELFARWRDDPDSVDSSWAALFADLNGDGRAILEELEGAEWGRVKPRVIGNGHLGEVAAPGSGNGKAAIAHALHSADSDAIRAATLDSLRALMLIRAYRDRKSVV